MSRLIAVLLFLVSTRAGADMTVGAFYDVERRIAILEQTWFVPIGGKWSAFGFNEFYREPQQGYPAESNVWFGKSWVMRDITPSLKAGIEVEHGYNNAGMWTRNRPFEPNQARFLPKFGVQWRIW